MGMFSFDYCCFCIDLRIGCLIIGYLSLIGNIALVVLAAYGIEGGVLIKSLDVPAAQETGIALIATDSIVLIIEVVFTIFTIFLLYGVHKNRPKFIKAYLVYSVIYLVIYAIMFFVALGNGKTGTGDIIEGVVTLLLNIYFLLVIKSYYDTLQVEEVRVSYRP